MVPRFGSMAQIKPKGVTAVGLSAALEPLPHVSYLESWFGVNHEQVAGRDAVGQLSEAAN